MMPSPAYSLAVSVSAARVGVIPRVFCVDRRGCCPNVRLPESRWGVVFCLCDGRVPQGQSRLLGIEIPARAWGSSRDFDGACGLAQSPVAACASPQGARRPSPSMPDPGPGALFFRMGRGALSYGKKAAMRHAIAEGPIPPGGRRAEGETYPPVFAFRNGRPKRWAFVSPERRRPGCLVRGVSLGRRGFPRKTSRYGLRRAHTPNVDLRVDRSVPRAQRRKYERTHLYRRHRG